MEVSEILALVPIEEYIGQYVELSEKGGELWGLSPFKDEKTPSFSVRPGSGIFYDFSSGSGGNLVDFIMLYHGVTLPRAINMVKAYAHISEDESGAPVARLQTSKVARRYRSSSKKSPPPTCTVLPDDYMDRYEDRMDKVSSWVEEGISPVILNSCGVRYDAFANRIVYPIHNWDGKIINVCGRTLDPDYKAKGLRKYTYIHSLGTLDTLYGFHWCREHALKAGEIIIFEGAKSVMKCQTWGIENTVALLTSHLNSNQLGFLIRFCNPNRIRVVFALDSDVDITKDKNIQTLSKYVRVEWVANADGLLQEKDSPVDQGEDVFRRLYTMRRKMY